MIKPAIWSEGECISNDELRLSPYMDLKKIKENAILTINQEICIALLNLLITIGIKFNYWTVIS